MYCYVKSELPAQVQNAITLCELQGMVWEDLYMDPQGELAVAFKGKLSEDQIKMVNMHFLDLLYGDTQEEKYNQIDYDYNNGKTSIFNPDGEDFKRIFA